MNLSIKFVTKKAARFAPESYHTWTSQKNIHQYVNISLLIKLYCFTVISCQILLILYMIFIYHNDPKFSDRYAWANSADPDQTAPRGAV